jgi:hypothetical protein
MIELAKILVWIMDCGAALALISGFVLYRRSKNKGE